MRICLRRREFIAGLGGAAAAWPLAVRGQQGDRVRRIGVLMPYNENDPLAKTYLSTFTQALAELVHPSGIEGLIFGSWATLSGERLSCVGPAEGPGHGGVEISDELLDPGLQHLLAGEVAAADKLSYQNGKPDFDLIEP